MGSSLHWQEQGKCIGKPTDYFFPPEGTTTKEDTLYLYGKALCCSCPVQQQCLNYAMTCEQGERWRYGLWGGKTPHERWVYHATWVGRPNK